MVVNGRPMKRMKRRVTADLHDFFTFPSSSSSSSSPSSNGPEPFRNNVRQFLSKHALPPPPSSLFPHLMTWQVLLRAGDPVAADANAPDSVICLDVVEEDVARSRSVYCDQCRVVGWSGHPVCGKRYHFIIKVDGISMGGYHIPCIHCGNPFHLSESRCRSCNHVMSTDDAEEWVVQQLENTTHLLHGVVHSNGFGHLLRVNGREGGSKLLSGSHIMHFWDRLCTSLAVRKVSVMDVSKKFGLEYRLLHAIIKGHPWYGEWGYEFGAGSFGIMKDDYDEAVHVLSTLPLSILTSKGRKPRTRLQDIVLVYQSLSENELLTIRDLFSFLILLIHETRKYSSRANNDAPCNKPNHCNAALLCPWSRADVEKVEEAMIRVLRAVSGSNWVSWRALRGAVCRLASPELLDYCLKELGGKPAAGGMIVHARCNPDSGAFEYRLESASLASSDATSCNGSTTINHPSEECVLRDLKYLYEAVLQPDTMLGNGTYVTTGLWKDVAQRILDCKKFVKDYKVEKRLSVANPAVLTISCQVLLADQPESGAINPPPEIVVLSPNATVSDLKVEASRAFQDVYLMLRRFQADDLVDYRGVDGSTQVRLLLGSSESVRIRGRCFLKIGLSRFKMERGVENWTVSCSCGIKDDDGERMLACDICGVWQHTRCSGIHDLEMVPTNFICWGCRSSGHMMRISHSEAKPPIDGNNLHGKGANSGL